MKPSTAAFFLPADGGRAGQRFGLLHTPGAGPVRGAVLYVHPFAEEMNKTRRMAALQARALAEAGHAVLQLDLHGCGDSSGDFGDATWQGWVDDVVQAAAWLGDRHPGPLCLWGLRAGCLLASAAAVRLAAPVDFLFWQPVTSGKQHLQQFLRLKVAGEMMSGQSKGVMDALKQRLAAGESVEIAGYDLTADVASGLDAATLVLPARTGRVIWREVSSQAEPTLSPASDRTLSGWRAQGVAVDAQVVAGPAFWQTVEIETAPALIASSVAALATPIAPTQAMAA